MCDYKGEKDGYNHTYPSHRASYWLNVNNNLGYNMSYHFSLATRERGAGMNLFGNNVSNLNIIGISRRYSTQNLNSIDFDIFFKK